MMMGPINTGVSPDLAGGAHHDPAQRALSKVAGGDQPRLGGRDCLGQVANELGQRREHCHRPLADLSDGRGAGGLDLRAGLNPGLEWVGVGYQVGQRCWTRRVSRAEGCCSGISSDAWLSSSCAVR